MNSSPRLYDDLAWLWPLLSPPDDYAGEAKIIKRLLRKHLGSPPRKNRQRVLELGAGGGHTLHHLTQSYDCTAVDLSDTMLDNSRRLNTAVTHHRGDMRDVRLGETFDAVLIHDAIDYMLTRDDLARTFTTAHAYLRPSGVLIVAPTYLRETFTNHETECDSQAGDDLELTYVSHVDDADASDDVFVLTLLMLIRKHGRLHIEEDRHTCGLFPRETWLHRLDQAGFNAEMLEEMNGAWHPFVAIRR